MMKTRMFVCSLMAASTFGINLDTTTDARVLAEALGYTEAVPGSKKQGDELPFDKNPEFGSVQSKPDKDIDAKCCELYYEPNYGI